MTVIQLNIFILFYFTCADGFTATMCCSFGDIHFLRVFAAAVAAAEYDSSQRSMTQTMICVHRS